MTLHHMVTGEVQAVEVEDLVGARALEEMVEEVTEMVGYQVFKKRYLAFLVKTTQSMLMSLNQNSHVTKG